MSLSRPTVFVTRHKDGSADMTLSVDEDNYKFSVSPEGDTAWVEYEETLLWRGEIGTREPDEEIWKMLMQSEKMTEYLESSDVTAVRRKR